MLHVLVARLAQRIHQQTSAAPSPDSTGIGDHLW